MFSVNQLLYFDKILDANELIGATYTNNIYQKILPNNFNIPFIYIGWTFGSLIGSSATQLELLELLIFGKDDISNNTLNIWNKNNLDIYNTLGNIGIGTSDNINYTLTVNGNINASSISSNSFDIDLLYTKNTTTSNLLYNTIYTAENQYPPKLFDNYSNLNNVSNEIFNINPTNPLKEVITINPTSGITNGIGNYTIYSSSRFSTNFQSNLFNFNSISTNGQWGFNYEPFTSYYINERNNYIKNDYKGDWIIIKLPSPIILTKFTFTAGARNERNPSLWRCYGSNDGANFILIPEASNEFTPISFLNVNPIYIYDKFNDEFII